ncbi:MAG: alpha-L-rhamnosidase [Acidobacteria bacterium]|nr:alpha-L-rhamnosidase [Acidobacteriota bacterium]
MIKPRFRARRWLAVVAVCFSSAWGGLPPQALKPPWHAQWITSPRAPARDAVVLHFRKIFALSEAPENFVVRVSADSQFILSVNQREIGRGPALSDLAHWRYETYDLAAFLRPGENEISATVWTFGTLSPLAQTSDRIALVVEGDRHTKSVVDTDKSWEVEEDKGIEALPKPAGMENFYYAAEPGERIDGARFNWSWDGPPSAEDKWEKAVPIGKAIERGSVLQEINWQLTADPLPPMEMKPEAAGGLVRASGIEAREPFPGNGLEIPAHSSVILLLDQTHLTTAYPELTVTGGAGSAIRLTYAEALVGANGEKGNRNEVAGKHIVGIFDEFLPDGAAHRRFMPLAWRTWRYLELDISTADGPLQIENLRTWFTAYPFEERGHFDGSDPSLDQIWQIGWRTARLDAHSTYMDTPYWERLQYIGDTRIQALVSYAVSGDDRLARQAIQAFNDSRIPDGITRSRYPSSVTQIIPTFSLVWVGMVHDFWMYRGDEEFVKSQIDGTRTVLDWFLRRQRADGLLGRLPWWPFIDWGKDFSFGVPPEDDDGGSSVITLEYMEALGYGRELESAFGDPIRAQRYREAESRAREAVRKLCWNDRAGLIADTPRQAHYSQHANILGVWLDAVPREREKRVLDKILSVSDPGFSSPGPVPEMTQATYYFRFYLARALEHAGMGDRYLELLKPWHDMVALGLTTWAEQPEPTRSDSHAWSAHPNFDLLRIVAGIRPRSPGFSSVTIAPHLGRLKRVTAREPTPRGMVEVSYLRKSSGVAADIHLPPGVAGELVWKAQRFTLHGGDEHIDLP